MCGGLGKVLQHLLKMNKNPYLFGIKVLFQFNVIYPASGAAMQGSRLDPSYTEQSHQEKQAWTPVHGQSSCFKCFLVVNKNVITQKGSFYIPPDPPPPGPLKFQVYTQVIQ